MDNFSSVVRKPNKNSPEKRCKRHQGSHKSHVIPARSPRLGFLNPVFFARSTYRGFCSRLPRAHIDLNGSVTVCNKFRLDFVSGKDLMIGEF